MKIIISPYSKKLQTGKPNAKNYPYWPELINLLRKERHTVIQIGEADQEKLTDECFFDLKIPELVKLIETVDTFISVDNFFHHFADYYGLNGIVIFSRSDPHIFGYEKNTNIYLNNRYLRPDQFNGWEQCDYLQEAFVKPKVIMEFLKT